MLCFLENLTAFVILASKRLNQIKIERMIMTNRLVACKTDI